MNPDSLFAAFSGRWRKRMGDREPPWAKYRGKPFVELRNRLADREPAEVARLLDAFFADRTQARVGGGWSPYSFARQLARYELAADAPLTEQSNARERAYIEEHERLKREERAEPADWEICKTVPALTAKSERPLTPAQRKAKGLAERLRQQAAGAERFRKHYGEGSREEAEREIEAMRNAAMPKNARPPSNASLGKLQKNAQ